MRDRFAPILGLGLGLLMWALAGGPESLLGTLEQQTYDFRFELQGPVSRPAPEIVIVDIDDPSLEAFGDFPWPRGRHAELLGRLDAWGARLIAMDITFLKPGRDPAEDEKIRKAILKVKHVVLAGVVSAKISEATAEGNQQLAYQAPIFEALHGAVNYRQDPTDGAVRQSSLFTVERLMSWDLTILRELDRGMADRAVDRFRSDPYLIRYAGPPGTYPTASYASVLKNILDPRIDAEFVAGGVKSYGEFFKGKIVLVGSSAPILHDMFGAPLAKGDLQMSGVEIHANAIDTLRRMDAPMALPWAAGLAITVLAAMAAALLLAMIRPRRGALALLGAMGAYGVVEVALFRAGVVLPTLPPLVAAALAFPGVYGRRFMLAERDKARIRATFSRYVAPKVVDEMLKHPDQVPGLRNERRFVTVLFTDIEGFTSFAEGNPPDKVAERLNEILTALTQKVFDHGGTLDKYIGDAVMAIWGNVGQSDPDADALGAAEAALAMQEAMTELRARWAVPGDDWPLKVRIGIHSGEALVGNFGSPLKLDFTAIGDTVNIASRLEGLNKQFGTAIIVSGATASLLAGKVELQALGEATLKGKSTGTLAYELVALQSTSPVTRGVSK